MPKSNIKNRILCIALYNKIGKIEEKFVYDIYKLLLFLLIYPKPKYPN